MKMIKFLKCCSFVAAVSMFTQAQAAAVVVPSVSGEMGYSTESNPATIWNFNALTDMLTIGNAQVDIGSSDLSTLPGDLFVPISFNYGLGFAPLEIWSAGDFSFELQSVTVLFESGQFLSLMGQGVISSISQSFTDTAASWEFTGNKLTFSAATLAQPAVVPVPAALILFASALLTMPLARFKKKQ